MDQSSTGQKNGDKRTGAGKVQNRIVGVVLAVVFTATFLFTVSSSRPANLTGSAAMLSARLSVPQGGSDFLAEQVKLIMAMLNPSKGEENQQETDLSSSQLSSLPQSSSSGTSGSSSSTESSGIIPKTYKPVQTVQFGAQSGKGYETYAGLCVDKLTTQLKSADIQKQLSVKPDIKISLQSAPQVLIIHTHTTESYSSADDGYYDPNTATRDTDRAKSVVRVGDEIAASLAKNGIGVYHDTAYNDYPEYDGAYTRSLAAIQNDLKKYPSIKVVLDIHRDSIQLDDGTRLKPTVLINGKKAAQVMLISACGEPNSSMTVPAWQWNYRFALRIEQQLNKSYPGLARPIDLVDKQYNEQVSHGTLLVEFGTDVNTLDEAVYSGQLFGKAMAALLKTMQ